MSFKRCIITNFRNISHADLTFNANFNIFYGENGSGKTSLLEAIYYLVHNKSFRSHLNKRIIAYDESHFDLFSQFNDLAIGIHRDTVGKNRIKLNSSEKKSISAITQAIPVQLLDNSFSQLLDESPEYRRNFLNWGVFYVEPTFAEHWKAFRLLLKQRNAALRNKLSKEQVSIWDKQLIEHVEAINQARNRYFDAFMPLFTDLLQESGLDYAVKIAFQPGWSKDLSFAAALETSFIKDRELQYTTVGPHRANIIFNISKNSAKDGLSRGEKKLLVYLLKLAQAQHIKELTGKSVVFLLDDLPAELDTQKQEIVLKLLKKHGFQVFLSSIYENLPSFNQLEGCSMFHVEHGQITQQGNSRSK